MPQFAVKGTILDLPTDKNRTTPYPIPTRPSIAPARITGHSLAKADQTSIHRCGNDPQICQPMNTKTLPDQSLPQPTVAMQAEPDRAEPHLAIPILTLDKRIKFDFGSRKTLVFRENDSLDRLKPLI